MKRLFAISIRNTVLLGALFLSLLGLTILQAGGCSRERSHAILVTFFDGVPPLYPVEESPPPVSPQFLGRRDRDRGPVKWFFIQHKPHEEGKCTRCHPKDQAYWLGLDFDRRGFCFSCHEHVILQMRLEVERFLHGPVSVNSCLVCHEPHKGIYPNLLVEKDPELCYRCHEKNAVLSTQAHLDLSEETCLPCHDPHGGAVQYLLRGEARP